MRLLSERALLWPRLRTLIVADVHLGKGAAFRRAGVAVPSGATAADLARLSRLVQQHAAERLLVLGDLFHAALQREEPWFAAMEAFCTRHRALQIEIARGNHDRSPGPVSWNLQWRPEAWCEGPFVFMHAPQADARGYALGGHLHPVLRLQSDTDRLRLPVFWLRSDSGVLPSFGSFTGGHPVEPAPEDRLYAVLPDAVLDVSAQARARTPQSRL